MIEDKIKLDFPMLLTHPQITYLDSASTALTPQGVIEAIDVYYKEHNTNTSRGVDRLLYETTDMFEAVREKVQHFLGAKSVDEIIFTRGTTDSLNMVAFGLLNELAKNDEIILNIAEHHANIIPWQEVAKRTGSKIVYVNLLVNGSIDIEHLATLLNEKTRIVSFAHVTNVFGSFNDPNELIPLIRQKTKNALVVIDGAQGIVQETVDVVKMDCDFYAFSGHKLFGPTGIGVLYGKEDLLHKMVPLTFGGDMNFSVGKLTSEYKEAPHKFEAGTMMIAEVLGLGAAIDYFMNIDLKVKDQHIQSLRSYAFDQLAQVDHVDIYNQACLNSTTIAFNIKGLPAHDAASMFSNNDVVIRAGHHCAQLLLEHINAPSSLRASFSIYNTKEDVDAFMDVINKLKDEGAFLDVLFG